MAQEENANLGQDPSNDISGLLLALNTLILERRWTNIYYVPSDEARAALIETRLRRMMGAEGLYVISLTYCHMYLGRSPPCLGAAPNPLLRRTEFEVQEPTVGGPTHSTKDQL